MLEAGILLFVSKSPVKRFTAEYHQASQHCFHPEARLSTGSPIFSHGPKPTGP